MLAARCMMLPVYLLYSITKTTKSHTYCNIVQWVKLTKMNLLTEFVHYRRGVRVHGNSKNDKILTFVLASLCFFLANYISIKVIMMYLFIYLRNLYTIINLCWESDWSSEADIFKSNFYTGKKWFYTYLICGGQRDWWVFSVFHEIKLFFFKYHPYKL